MAEPPPAAPGGSASSSPAAGATSEAPATSGALQVFLPGAPAASATDAPPAPPAPPPPTPRATPRPEPEAHVLARKGALVVELDGARFTVTASPFPQGKGWGVRVSVEASSADNEPHAIDGDETNLVFSGTIEALDDGELGAGFGEGGVPGGSHEILPGKPLRFHRDYPGKNDWSPIERSQRLDLTVSLWSLSSMEDEEAKRWLTPHLLSVELTVPRVGAPHVKLSRAGVAVGR
jgi:hypothetical protein